VDLGGSWHILKIIGRYHSKDHEQKNFKDGSCDFILLGVVNTVRRCGKWVWLSDWNSLATWRDLCFQFEKTCGVMACGIVETPTKRGGHERVL